MVISIQLHRVAIMREKEVTTTRAVCPHPKSMQYHTLIDFPAIANGSAIDPLVSPPRVRGPRTAITIKITIIHLVDLIG